MKHALWLLLLAAGCGSSDPLVGSWTGMLPTAPAMASQEENWIFTGDQTATRVTIIHYNSVDVSVSGCLETIIYSFPTWTDTGSTLTIEGGAGTDQQDGCDDPNNNYDMRALPGGLMLSGTYAVSGNSLTLTLNGSTEMLTRK